MEVKQIAALPKQLAVMDIEMSDDVLTITTLSTQACPCCPLCGKPSARIHSRYLRQVADLPCGGRQAWRACHRAAGNTDLAPYHSPAHYGLANRAGWADYRAWY